MLFRSEVIAMIRDFNNRYGGVNPDGSIKNPMQLNAAWRQLTTGPGALDASWQFAARAMGLPEETLVYNALRVDQKELAANLGTLTKQGTSYTDIANQVLNETKDLNRALTGNMPERMTVYNGARELITKMAALEIGRAHV